MFLIFEDIYTYFLCSKRRFRERQAEEWWNKNKDRVLKKYSTLAATKSEGSASSNTLPPPPAEENIEAMSS